MSRLAAAAVTCAAAGLGYGGLVERNAFALRRFDVPVLPPATPAVRLLHISDLHLTARQHRKQDWVRRLAELEPDLVINTGDTLSAADSIPAVLHTLEPLFGFPGAFIPGNNDYYAPRPKNPLRYFFSTDQRSFGGRPLPWPELATAMADAGWLDLTHRRARLAAGGATLALTGTDDAHLGRARYELVAGAADPDATVRIGVLHTPEPELIDHFTADGYDLVLAGHTHGGQVRVPFGPAIVTNCALDVHRARWLSRWDGPAAGTAWLHVSAGLGTNPYAPMRFACRPEATLLTLVPRAG